MAEASAPASSANLGPGYDTIALAWELRCLVRARRAAEWSVEHTGLERIAPEAPDAVLFAAQRAVGVTTPLALTVENAVPIGKGLGSSAAALAAGAAAAWLTVVGEVDHRDVFDLVAEVEDHGDNAAAAVYGGLAAVDASGDPLPLEIHHSLVGVALVPDEVLPTAEAREALSETIDRGTVVRSLGRLVALVEGLRHADPELLGRAAGDELHEDPRRSLYPAADELMDLARSAGAMHAAWSGAGPSVIAICDTDRAGSIIDAAVQAGVGARRLDVAAHGLELIAGSGLTSTG